MQIKIQKDLALRFLDQKKMYQPFDKQINFPLKVSCHNSTTKKIISNEQETNPNSAVQSSQSTIKLHDSSQAETVIYHKDLQDESMRLFTFMNSSQKDKAYFIDEAGNFNQNLKCQIQSKNLMNKHPESIIQLIQVSRKKRQKFLNQISLDLNLQLLNNNQIIQKGQNYKKCVGSKSTKNSKNYNLNYNTLEKEDFDNKNLNRRGSLTPKIFKANQKSNNSRLFRAKSTLSNLKNIRKQQLQQANSILTPNNNNLLSKTPKSKTKKVSMFSKQKNEPISNCIMNKQSNLNLNLKMNSKTKYDSYKKEAKSCRNNNDLHQENIKNLIKKKKQLQKQLLEINENILFKKKTKKTQKPQQSHKNKKESISNSKNGCFSIKKQKQQKRII